MSRTPRAWPRQDGGGAASAPTNWSPSGPPSRVAARLQRARVRPPSRPPPWGRSTGRRRAEVSQAARATAPEAPGAARSVRCRCADASHPGPRGHGRCSGPAVAQSSAAQSSSPRRHPRSCAPALTTRSPESAASRSDPGPTGASLPDPRRSDDQQPAPWLASATHGAPAYPLLNNPGSLNPSPSPGARITGDRDLALVVGYAGTGKSTMLGAAREAWEAQGYTVRGAALSGIAAESLEGGSGITSRTLASLEHAWGQGRDQLTGRDVLVIDEAGMVGSRPMERVLSHAAEAGAKVVLVGDPEQLQAIEAGAAFRALSERHGAAEITQVRRQHQAWQREATKELATERTAAALERYERAGMVHGHATKNEAKAALVAGWDAARRVEPERSPGRSQVILASTRADVRDLNELARATVRAAGALGADRTLATERGERAFAVGDRVMFLRNERSFGVKNGTLGTLERLESSSLLVRLDDQRAVSFDLKDYAHVDHGYAATIHKAQGITVDRAHVLASSHLDRHAAYVGLTRHREGVALHWACEDLRDRAGLDRVLSCERAKDTTLDYQAGFAERRGIPARSPILVERGPSRAGLRRGLFAGLNLDAGAD